MLKPGLTSFHRASQPTRSPNLYPSSVLVDSMMQRDVFCKWTPEPKGVGFDGRSHSHRLTLYHVQDTDRRGALVWLNSCRRFVYPGFYPPRTNLRQFIQLR